MVQERGNKTNLKPPIGIKKSNNRQAVVEGNTVFVRGGSSQQQTKTGAMTRQAPSSSNRGQYVRNSGGSTAKQTRMASAQVARMAPKPFSPLFEESNLMLPRDRKTLNAWCRHYLATDPIVRNAITLHAQYPLSRFNLKCEDSRVKNLIGDMLDDINIMDILYGIGVEYWALGECLYPGTLIETEVGFTPIEKLRRNIKVTTHKGRLRNIKDLKAHTVNENLYSVEVEGIRCIPLQLTGNHPLFATQRKDVKCLIRKKDKYALCWPNKCSAQIKRNGKIYPGCENKIPWNIDFIRTQELVEGDYLYQAIDETVESIEYISDDWCKLFGWFLSKGSFYKNTNKGTERYGVYTGVTIAVSEEEIVEDLRSLCERNDWSYRTFKRSSGIWGIVITSLEIVNQFLYHGGEYSASKKLSKEIMKLPFEQQRKILVNYINGDGSVDKKDGNIQLSSNSLELIMQFRLLLARLGITVVISKHKGEYAGSNKEYVPSDYNYRLYIKTLYTHNFTDIMTRKAQFLKFSSIETRGQFFAIFDNVRYLVMPIRKISNFNYSGLVFNLEVEDDHSYIANGIVSHNCFPFAELDERKGVWSGIILHNPDYVDVRANVLSKQPIINLLPDENLKNIINSTAPEDIKLKAQLDPAVIQLVQHGKPIPLDNFNVSAVLSKLHPYDVRGTGLLTSCFKDLMHRDKLREMQYAIADNYVLPLKIFKIGDPTGDFRPEDSDIEDFQSMLEEAMYDPNFVMVTHGAVSTEMVGWGQSVYGVDGDLQIIYRNLMMGLMVPEPMITQGEIGNKGNTSMGGEILRNRYIVYRNMIQRWLEKKIIEPICRIHEFYKVEDGKKKLIVPEIVWNKIILKDVDSYISTLSQLMPAGIVSPDTVMDVLDLDVHEEMKKTRESQVRNVITQKELQQLAVMAPSQLVSIDPQKSIFEQLSTLPGEIPVGAAPPPGAPGADPMAGGMGGDMGGLGGMPPGGGGVPPGGMGEAAPMPGMDMGAGGMPGMNVAPPGGAGGGMPM